MRSPWRHLLHRRNDLPVALWLLLLLTANALQVVSATHWHSTTIDHDGCLLCQVAAHTGSGAPPPAPWALFCVAASHAAELQVIHPAVPQSRASYSWQGRAPPLV
jgi:hypothetical protein